MQFILEYPNTLPGLLKMSQKNLHEEMRFIIAGKLYDMGKLSSGKAAELAGISRVEFLSRLSQYGFHAINIDEEQIDLEIEGAKDLPA